MGRKKTLSPVIATVLLVALVIVMGSIVFLWMKGSVKEVIYKFSNQNIEISCTDVSFDAEYSVKEGTEIIYVINNGNIPIKDFKVQLIKSGTKTTFNLEGKDIIDSLNGETFSGISSGNGKKVDVSGENVGNADEILVIPILQGRNDAGILKNYICDEKYGEKRYKY